MSASSSLQASQEDGNASKRWHPIGLRRWATARSIAAVLFAAALFGAGEARANVTGTWTATATGGSATANGLTVTIASSAAAGATQTFNTVNSGYWTDPHTPTATIAGVASLQLTIPTGGSTVTITFSKPVDNPVMHIDRLGGVSGASNSSSWTLSGSVATSAVSLSRLSGNSQFVVTGANFVRTTGVASAVGTECDGTTNGTACGSIQFVGTNITQLSFNVVMAGSAGSGDALELAFTVPETFVVVRKQTVNVTAGPFTFAGTNGVGSPTLNTATTNPISSASYSVTNHANPITISETVPAGYRIDSTSCTDGSGASIASTFTGSVTGTGTINIATGAYDGGGQTITCLVVNKSRSDMSVDLSGLTPATLNTPYTGTYTCSNAASPFLQADAATCAISGLPAGLTSSCSPVPPTNVASAGVITCTVSGTPTSAGTVTVTGTTSATNDLNLPNNTATASFTVQSSDMSISLAGLPTTASIGVAYSGSFTCTNGASPSVTAAAATCAVAGLPAGLTTSCSPTPPTSVAPSGVITCTVSGTPTATGTVSVSGTTGATNDSNSGNNSATTSIAVTGSDMSVDLSGLPTSASIGVPYSGTIKCTNNSSASASATNATCSTSGLPAGVTVGTCTPAPPATVAAGASISCSVSGTPTATGTSTVTTSTGATNDLNGGTTTGGNNTSTASVTVTGSDMSPDLTGLPATATVGTPYSGTIKCTNSASATASATSATCSISGLPPGVTVGTCTPTPPATVAAGASISCPVSGTPTAAGTTTATVQTGAVNDSNGGTTSGGNNTATKAVATSGSDMSISLSGLPTSGAVGQPYSGSFTCTNSSSASMSATSAACSVSGLPAGLSTSCTPTPPATVAAGASIVCTVTGTPTTSGTSPVNGTTGASNDPNTANNSAATSIAIGTPALAVTKASTTSSFNATGVSVPYTFVVQNSGTVTIFAPISVTDSKIASVSCPALPPGGLAPAAFITCTGSYTTTQPDLDAGSVVNAAAAHSGTTNSSTATHTLPAAQTRSLSLVKTASPTTYSAPGISIGYTYVVRNTGNVTIPASATMTVTDDKIASVSCPAIPAGGLAPNATLTCSATHTTTQANVDAGSITNVASASDGTATSPTATATVTAVQTNALSIAKSTTATTFASVGQVIPYSFRVTNAGNTTVNTAISVSDSRIASVTCPALPAGGLAPASFITCTGSYTIAQADIDAGAVTNIASATSGTVTSPPVSHTLTGTQSPALTIAKSSTASTYSTAGAAIPYSYRVTNSGNTTLTASIAVADNKIASVTCPALPAGGLVPGAFITCTGTYTVTQADVDAGSLTNIASATSGALTSPTATLTITATQAPAMTVLKTSPTTTFSTAGIVIPYSYRVTNSGNTTLSTAISITDNKIASVTCPALPAGGLLPGAFITCSGSYTTTQADVDAGGVTNSASAKSGTVTSPPVTLTITAPSAPALLVVKSSTTTSFGAAGIAIPYSYLVTNTGNITLTAAIAVTDSKIASVTCPALPAGGLAPGASITCAATYTTVQADVDAGGVTNTASAKSGTTTSPTTSLTVPATQSPAIAVTKSSTSLSFAAAGVAIPYSYRVTNTGNTTLTSAITVSDDKIASVSCPALPAGGLVPGAFVTCSGTYTTTQADVDAGGVTNNATARSGAVTSPTVSLTIASTRAPAMTIAKTTTTTSFSAPGVSVPFSYKVTNSGNTTLTAAITVADNKIASVACPALPAGGLAPGAFITCTGTYVTTQADVDAGGVTNIASATSGSTTSPTATVTVGATQSPSLTIAKSSTSTSYASAGQTVPYSYRVTNSGNVTLTAAITVSDNKIAAVTCPSLPAGGLAPAAFITCTATYTVTQADLDGGSLTNIASAKSGTTTSPTTTLTIAATQAPALAIAKSSTSTSFAAPGTAIPYSYRVTNTGNVTLTQPITVADNRIASVACPALPAGGLVPGAFITCTGTYTTTQSDLDAGQVTNLASAASGSTTSPTATLTITATQTPALAVLKTSTATSFAAVGVVIPYSYRVTNTGNVTLTQPITVADNKIASVTCPALPAGGLAPGAFIACSGSYTTTQSDLDAGAVTNTASATSGTTVSPVVTLTITATQAPALTIAKTSTTSNFNSVGTVIPYSYKVTNSGNVTLTQPITVADNKIASVTCPALPAGGLAPGAFITCTASYTTVQADLDAGGVTNTATARSGTTLSPPVSLTVAATQTPALTVDKTSTVTSFNAVGVVIPYSYKVTNTGNVTLTAAITVSDDKISSVSCPALPAGGLAPGAFVTCTGSYTTTQADLDAGRVTNIAGATSGTTTSPSVTLTVTGVQQPALSVVKSSTTTNFNTVGTVIPYTYKVTNSGNTSLMQPITVSDDKIASVSCPALPAGGLAPGAFITCTGSYTTTQADLDAGQVTNHASARSGATTSAVVNLTIGATQTPALTIVKSSTSTTYTIAGEVVPYSYKVTNSGNLTLTSAVTVSDDKIPSVSCPALPVGGLVPGASITCTATYTVKQSDLNAGTLTNVASAASGAVVSPPVSLTLTGTITPNFTIAKSTASSLATNNGDGTFTTTFRVVATNTGNVDLTQIKLTDDYASTLPAGAVVVGANFTSLVSSTRGPLSSGNTSYDAKATSPELIRLPGESLAVGEVVTATFSITFDPGANPSGTSFNNTVVGNATLTSGSTTIYSESKNSIAIVTFQPSTPLTVVKSTTKPEITVGGLVPYTITVRNDDTIARTGISVVDMIPAGFKYRDGSGSVNGVAKEPVLAGRQLTWANLSVPAKSAITIKLILVAGAGLTSGEFTNEAWAIDTSTGLPISNVGTAKVRIVPDATFDCTDIIGKVFDDANRNGYLDDGERGIANVRLVTVNGQIVTTDSEGRYHIACADIPNAFRGSNFVLKLDVRSLPTGYRVTTENPMSMRITAGKMAKMNFGASIQRVVRIDLMDAAFETGSTTLRSQWAQSVDAMIPALVESQAVLRIAYRRGASEDKALAVERLRALEGIIRSAWSRQNGKGELPVESEVYLEAPQAQPKAPTQAPAKKPSGATPAKPSALRPPG